MKIEIKHLFLILFVCSSTSLKSQSIDDKLVLVAETKGNSVLTQVVDLDFSIGSQGQIILYVSDVFSPHVIVASKDGNVLQFSENLGREGKGPGEFLEVTNLQVLSENRLLVYDGVLSRITILNTISGKVVETINLNRRRSIHNPFQLYKFDGQDSLIYAISKQFFSDTFDPNDKRSKLIQAFGNNGNLNIDSILVKPADEAFVFMKNGGMSVNPNPDWGHKSIVKFQNGHIYYIHTQSPIIEQFDKNGNFNFSINIDPPKLPITDDDKKRILAREAMFMDLRESVIQQDLYDRLPKSWPLIHDFHIDKNGKFWIALPSHMENEKRVWWILNPEAEVIDKINLPQNFIVHQVKSDYIVGELFNYDNFDSRIQIYKYAN